MNSLFGIKRAPLQEAESSLCQRLHSLRVGSVVQLEVGPDDLGTFGDEVDQAAGGEPGVVDGVAAVFAVTLAKQLLTADEPGVS